MARPLLVRLLLMLMLMLMVLPLLLLLPLRSGFGLRDGRAIARDHTEAERRCSCEEFERLQHHLPS